MGVVYRAEDTRLGRSVALKFLRAQAIVGDEDRARFVREARSAAALDHPNICTVYEVGEADGQTYISMAYIEGHELRDEIRKGPIEVSRAISIAREIASGLSAAHKKGIVHRDIKSSNIMLTDDGRVRIMDFGLAKSEDSTKVTRSGMTIGTAAYMSPEQALGQDVDQRTDIWSLGVVLYEMLTGQLPFRGDYEPAMLYSIINETPDPPTELRSEIPLEIEKTVSRALEKNPDKRYPDAVGGDSAAAKVEGRPQSDRAQPPGHGGARLLTRGSATRFEKNEDGHCGQKNEEEEVQHKIHR